MKRFASLWGVLFLILAGCASHYVRVKDNSVFVYLKNPEAQSVYFLCSLDGYEIHKANKIDKKTWLVRIPKGREFIYFYIVDEKPFLPDCTFREKDDFGSQNCIYVPKM